MPNKSMTWGAVATSLDISRLNDLGICVSQDNEILYNEQFNYYIIKFYANYGTGQVSVDTSNFYITKGYPLDVTTNQHAYLTLNQSGVNVTRGASGSLVVYGGNNIEYNQNATYTIDTMNDASHHSIDTTYFSIIDYNGIVGIHLSEDSPVQVYNNVQSVTFTVTVHSRVGDEVTINADLPYTTQVTSYKLRLADQYPDAEWFYFAADKSEEILEGGVPHPLYKADGTLATKTDYADCEFEALNPMPSEDIGMYGRFTTAAFSFATYQSTADVLHVEFTGLHQEEDEYCFADRLRVVVTASPTTAIPMGGMISPTGHSTYYVQELPKQIIVDNITLSGFMNPTSELEEYFGNDQLEPGSITINNDDVIIPLYDFDVPVTDQSKLYGVTRLNGTGTGNIPGDDDISKPLMLKATQDNSSVAYGGGSLPYTYSYSMDGTTWISYSLNTVIPLNKDEVVYFKRVGHTGSGTPSTSNHHKFTMTGKIEAYHNINSMLIEGDFETADTLTEWCGIYMFAECVSLMRAPLLPATTLEYYCYYCMFYMCTSLVNAPELPATTLAAFCYSDMFHGCSNLVNAPELPVMTLVWGCYNGMFYNCPSLVNAPELPATMLVEGCYKYMFGCCVSLSYIRIFATNISARDCLTYWLQNASSTGDIYCVNGVNYPTGDDGIPSGWTRHDI